MDDSTKVAAESVLGVKALTDLFQKVSGQRISRQTVYYYVSIGLLEPSGREGGTFCFTSDHAALLLAIRRLMGPRFRYRLQDIRDDVFPHFTLTEIASMPGMSSEALEDLLRERRYSSRKPR